MTNSVYRCAGCRQYRNRPEYRTLGLSSVCSPECLAHVGRARAKAPASPHSIDPSTTRAVDERDRHRCRLCGTRENLHHHHIAYRSEGGTDDEANLITLCLECHAIVHSDKRRWQPVLFAYIRAYYGTGRRLSLIRTDADRRAD